MSRAGAAVDVQVRADGPDLLVEPLAAYVVPDAGYRPVDGQLGARQEVGHGEDLGLHAAEALEGRLCQEDGPQGRLVGAHEELPGVVRARGEGPLDPLVDRDLGLCVGLRGVLLAHFPRDEVAAVPGEHRHDKDAPRHLCGRGLHAELVADLQDLEQLGDGVHHLPLLVLHPLALDHALQRRPADPEVVVSRDEEDAPELALEHREREAQVGQGVGQIPCEHEDVVAEGGGGEALAPLGHAELVEEDVAQGPDAETLAGPLAVHREAAPAPRRGRVLPAHDPLEAVVHAARGRLAVLLEPARPCEVLVGGLEVIQQQCRLPRPHQGLRPAVVLLRGRQRVGGGLAGQAQLQEGRGAVGEDDGLVAALHHAPVVERARVAEHRHAQRAFLEGLGALVAELCYPLGGCARVVVPLPGHVPVAVQGGLTLRDQREELARDLAGALQPPRERRESLPVLVQAELRGGAPQPALGPLRLVDGRVRGVLEALLPVEELAVHQRAVREERGALEGLEVPAAGLQGLAVAREGRVPVLLLERPVARLLLGLPALRRRRLSSRGLLLLRRLALLPRRLRLLPRLLEPEARRELPAGEAAAAAGGPLSPLPGGLEALLPELPEPGLVLPQLLEDGLQEAAEVLALRVLDLAALLRAGPGGDAPLAHLLPLALVVQEGLVAHVPPLLDLLVEVQEALLVPAKPLLQELAVLLVPDEAPVVGSLELDPVVVRGLDLGLDDLVEHDAPGDRGLLGRLPARDHRGLEDAHPLILKGDLPRELLHPLLLRRDLELEAAAEAVHLLLDPLVLALLVLLQQLAESALLLLPLALDALLPVAPLPLGLLHLRLLLADEARELPLLLALLVLLLELDLRVARPGFPPGGPCHRHGPGPVRGADADKGAQRPAPPEDLEVQDPLPALLEPAPARRVAHTPGDGGALNEAVGDLLVAVLDGGEGAAARSVGDDVLRALAGAQVEHRPGARQVHGAGTRQRPPLLLGVGLREAVDGPEVELQQELLLLGEGTLPAGAGLLLPSLLLHRKLLLQHVEVEGVPAPHAPRLLGPRRDQRRRRRRPRIPGLRLLVAGELVVREPEVPRPGQRAPPQPGVVSPEEAQRVPLRLEAQRGRGLREAHRVGLGGGLPDREDGRQPDLAPVPLPGRARQVVPHGPPGGPSGAEVNLEVGLVVEVAVVAPQQGLPAAGSLQAGHEGVALKLHVHGQTERAPASLVLRERQPLLLHTEGHAAGLAGRKVQQRVEEADQRHLALEGRRPGREDAVRGPGPDAQGQGDLEAALRRRGHLAQVRVRLVPEEEDEVAGQGVDARPVAVALQAVLAAVGLAGLDHHVEDMGILLGAPEGALHAVAAHLAHLQAAAQCLLQREPDLNL
mmetsp:Transcript_102944/g.327211  ORF Transcript_102944/g.327211 Transcript_102944/m.327211 type:complete len:1369 (+) Transcript_102944:175-4281(+)